jgi:hypothetical protein
MLYLYNKNESEFIKEFYLIFVRIKPKYKIIQNRLILFVFDGEIYRL